MVGLADLLLAQAVSRLSRSGGGLSLSAEGGERSEVGVFSRKQKLWAVSLDPPGPTVQGFGECGACFCGLSCG